MLSSSDEIFSWPLKSASIGSVNPFSFSKHGQLSWRKCSGLLVLPELLCRFTFENQAESDWFCHSLIHPQEFNYALLLFNGNRSLEENLKIER